MNGIIKFNILSNYILYFNFQASIGVTVASINEINNKEFSTIYLHTLHLVWLSKLNPRKNYILSLENFDPDNLVHSYSVDCVSIKNITEQLGTDVDLIKFDIEGRWFEICNEILDLDLKVRQVVGEFEMYMGEQDNEFKRLDSIIEKFKSKGYQIYCNRLLAEVTPGHIPNNPCVELAFIKI